MTSSTRATPAEIGTALEAEAAALDRYLAGLSAADLEKPSGCPEWSVADVVAHLARGALSYAGAVERARQGNTEPPAEPGAPRTGSVSADVAARAKQARAEIGEAVREALRDGNQVLGKALAAVGPDQWEQTAWSRLGPIPIRLVAQNRVAELALHSWDIRSVLDPPAHLHPATLPVLVDWLSRWFEVTFQPDGAQTAPVRLRFAWTDPAWAVRDLVIEPDSFRFEPATGQPADVTLRCPPEAAVLLATGRINLEQAQNVYELTLGGESDRAALLQARFPSF